MGRKARFVAHGTSDGHILTPAIPQKHPALAARPRAIKRDFVNVRNSPAYAVARARANILARPRNRPAGRASTEGVIQGFLAAARLKPPDQRPRAVPRLARVLQPGPQTGERARPARGASIASWTPAPPAGSRHRARAVRPSLLELLPDPCARAARAARRGMRRVERGSAYTANRGWAAPRSASCAQRTRRVAQDMYCSRRAGRAAVAQQTTRVTPHRTPDTIR